MIKQKIKCIARISEHKFITMPHWKGQTSEEMQWLKLAMLADIGLPITGAITPRLKKNYTIEEDHDFDSGVITYRWAKPDA